MRVERSTKTRHVVRLGGGIWALITFVLTLLCATSSAAESSPEQVLEQAVRTYGEAQAVTDRENRLHGFRQAERGFAQVIENGAPNADLLANWGTAALQGERLGQGVLAFKRALRIDPNHQRARQNLQHARTLLPAWVPRPNRDATFDAFFFWHYDWSKEERLGFAAMFFLVATLCFATAMAFRSPVLRPFGVVALCLWLALIASALFEEISADAVPAVVLAEAIARAADSENAPPRFSRPLPPGTEVDVVEFRGRWARVRLADARDAWVAQQKLGLAEAPAQQ